ncbi:MAG: HEAT repeat domain-containing protein [Phycisphaeraceae bacterium]
MTIASEFFFFARHHVLLVTLFVLCASLAFPAYADDLSSQRRLLLQHGVQPEVETLIKFLDDLQTDTKLEEQIDALIADLSSDQWQQREAATKNLIRIGQRAQDKLEQALESSDAEVRWRARRALDSLDANNESYIRRSLALAALGVLKSLGDPRSVEAIINVFTLFVDDEVVRNAASEALWASVDASLATSLILSIDDESDAARAPSVVALEIATAEAGPKVRSQTLKKIEALLGDQSARIRLAAARALLDHQPTEVIKVLVQLTSEANQEVAWKADALLSMKTGASMQLTDSQSLGDAWKQWGETSLQNADLSGKLGQRRLNLKAGRNWLDESFKVNKDSLADGYGQFEYESTNQGKASVTDGKLRIDGASKEGDQRLFITSQRMIGSDRWSDVVEVSAKLGGEKGGNYGWHMGVSVGKIKVLYHPGESKGYFRVEQTDTHEYITSNEDLTFAPVTGVMQEMVVRVQKTASGAEVDITVRDEDGKRPFNKRLTVTDQQLGEYNRIGLERSGRTGGGALFDLVSIRLSQ